MIDLRSDTVTTPSEEMRSAIANATVGDDVYHDDPTVNELERTVADLLGKEDAMFVPTGTMSNQIALRVHTEPGDSVVLHGAAHIARHELGGAAHNAGVTLQGIDGPHGTFTADQLRAKFPVPHEPLPGHLYDPVTLVCLENTHMEAGGTVWDPDRTREILEVAASLGMAAHLDGARLWNAAAASGSDIASLAQGFDTVNVCFSKGLGAPVGSALVGSRELITRGRRFKHIFGGGFRQAGLLAAGALFALDHNRERLVEDHANAHMFAGAINEPERATVDLASVQTNIVYFEVADAYAVVDACFSEGVSMLALGPTTARAVFHMHVSTEDTLRAAATVRRIVQS